MIGLCTDSNAQLPPSMARRYGVEVVPLTVTVDGQEFLEGVDLDADAFYARFRERTPKVSTAAPSPGRFAAAYRALADRGATEILSVHIGSSVSATLGSARLGSRLSPVPVRLVDTGTASFAISCCLWAAAEAVAAGAGLEEAAAAAEGVAGRLGNVFVVGALELTRAGGRLAPGVDAEAGEGIPVLTIAEGVIRAVGRVSSVEEAAEAMAERVLSAGDRLRVGVGVADAGAGPMGEALEARLAGAPQVLEVVRYRVGPSVGAHTGPGTAGAMYYVS